MGLNRELHVSAALDQAMVNGTNGVMGCMVSRAGLDHKDKEKSLPLLGIVLWRPFNSSLLY
jgi:hypothetical protein